VLGAEAWAEREKVRQKRVADGVTLGPRVTGPLKPPPPNAKRRGAVAAVEPKETPAPEVPPFQPPVEEPAVEAKPGPASGKGPMSVEQIKVALAENTTLELFDTIMALEFERPEGKPRKGALRLLIAAEQARTESRAAIVAELEQHLAGE
jgi:hypothetical protein